MNYYKLAAEVRTDPVAAKAWDLATDGSNGFKATQGGKPLNDQQLAGLNGKSAFGFRMDTGRALSDAQQFPNEIKADPEYKGRLDKQLERIQAYRRLADANMPGATGTTGTQTGPVLGMDARVQYGKDGRGTLKSDLSPSQQAEQFERNYGFQPGTIQDSDKRVQTYDIMPDAALNRQRENLLKRQEDFYKTLAEHPTRNVMPIASN